MRRANTPTDYLSGLVPAEAAAKKFYFAKGEYELAFAGRCGRVLQVYVFDC